MKRIPACDWRGALVTYGTVVPANVAAFGGRPFYVDTSTGRGYVLDGTTVVGLGTASTAPGPGPAPGPAPGPGPAPVVPNATGVTAVQVASGFSSPWAVAQLPNGRFLVTEKAAGVIKLLNGSTKTNLAGVPAAFYGSGDQHGGMLDLILDSQFATNRVLYFSYSAGTQAANGLRLARANLSADDTTLTNVTTLLTVAPNVAGTSQYGGRIAEGLDGTLFLSCGDRDGPHNATGCETAQMRTAQDWAQQTGKVLRVNKDGSVPSNNPFASSATVAQRLIYARGFRNPLGAAIAPDGALWQSENGPSGGDEFNRIVAGANYGWPYQCYGVHYGGCSIPNTATGVTGPAWRPAETNAPSGLLFIKGTVYGSGWQGNLISGSLADYSGNGGRRVYRLILDAAGTGIVGAPTGGRTTLWGGGTSGPRCRDVRQGLADGKIYVLTDDGRLMRLDPVFA